MMRRTLCPGMADSLSGLSTGHPGFVRYDVQSSGVVIQLLQMYRTLPDTLQHKVVNLLILKADTLSAHGPGHFVRTPVRTTVRSSRYPIETKYVIVADTLSAALSGDRGGHFPPSLEGEVRLSAKSVASRSGIPPTGSIGQEPGALRILPARASVTASGTFDKKCK